ncbi:Bax inhibitor-1/YccA family protein [Thalassotalea agarivorans]|uniref:Modulator of FtsH protease n=1 Tax=Thalassotalea agarivorans TaxID=349064 RepID=A0A1I0F1M1_THASX|nr:Bax inhibitor-1/YccA family protein [Thalassotalea agarivorans]SET50900.1 modulator of FtsH protease [Thalassotalea agarivorans]
MQPNMSYQSASQSTTLEINKVLKNTYMMLAMTLAFSALTAFISMAVGVGFGASQLMGLGAIAMVWFVIPRVVNKPSGIIWVFAFTGLLGASLGPLIAYYTASTAGTEILIQALGGTALIFFALSGYALTSKKDFSFMGGMLAVGAVVLIIGVIANIFLAIPALSLAISALFMFFSSAIILYQTSEIIHGGERNYLNATVTLYLSIYNIFVSLLHLLSAFGGDE